MDTYNIIYVGEQALSIEFPNKISPMINQRLQYLAKIIHQEKLTGVQAIIPAYHTLLVTFNLLKTNFQVLKTKLIPIINNHLKTSLPKNRVLIIPVCYEEPFNPDLKTIAKYAGITKKEVVKLHSKKKYPIYFLGFLPNFA